MTKQVKFGEPRSAGQTTASPKDGGEMPDVGPPSPGAGSAIRTYTCQVCSVIGTDKTRFKLLSVMKIGFVVCKACLRRWADD